jgi:Acetyltransferase (GNAT) domain
MQSQLFGPHARGGNAGHLTWQPLSQSRDTWQSLLSTIPGANLCHGYAWLELLSQAYGLSMWLATLTREGTVVAGCVFARSHNAFVKRFVSLPFSDNCPPLALDGEAARELLDALAAQAMPGTAYEIRGIEGDAPWETAGCFVNWRLNLQRPVASIEQGLALNFRRNLRRAAQAGIKVERGDDLDHLKRFYTLQVESRRRFGLPPQPWRFFKLARERFAPGTFEVWLASERQEDVAAAIFLRDGEVSHFKWGARRPDRRSNANHLLFWNAIEEFVPHTRALDLGRTDFRNEGLMRFKKELGATATPLPYSFYPRVPRQVSPEVLTGAHKVLAQVWRRLPNFASRSLSRAIYRFLA